MLLLLKLKHPLSHILLLSLLFTILASPLEAIERTILYNRTPTFALRRVQSDGTGAASAFATTILKWARRGIYDPISEATHLLVREGQPLLGKTVRRFQAFTTVAGSTAQTHSFNDRQELVVNVTNSDGTSQLVLFTIP